MANKTIGSFTAPIDARTLPRVNTFARQMQSEDDLQLVKQTAEGLFSRYNFGAAPMNIHLLPQVRNAFREVEAGVPVSKAISRMQEDILFDYFPDEYKALEEREIQEAERASRKIQKRPEPRTLEDLKMLQREKMERGPSSLKSKPMPITMPQGFSIGGRTRLI